MARLKAAALDGIHTTFIGVGLDFNTSLVEDISKVGPGGRVVGGGERKGEGEWRGREGGLSESGGVGRSGGVGK